MTENAPPAAPVPRRRAGTSSRWPQTSPPKIITVWAMALLGVCVLADAITIPSDLEQIALIERVVGGEEVPEAELLASDDKRSQLGLLQFAAWLGAAGVFITWTHHASKFAHGLRGRLEVSPGWAIGWWFVPLLSMVKPYMTVTEITRASDARRGPDWRRGSLPLFFPLWWLGFCAMNVMSYVSFRMMNSAQTAEEFLSAANLRLTSDVISIPAALLAILVVWTVRMRQDDPTHGEATADVFD